MIQAEELRIGNWVNYNDGSGHDDIRQIVGIFRNTVSSIVKGCHFATAIRSNELIYAIPISGEVLLECGFKLSYMSDSHCMYYWHEEITGLFEYIHGKIQYTIDSNIVCEMGYLHQLQNLFYALTGKELEVKL